GTLHVIMRAAVEGTGRGWVYLSPTDVELGRHDIVVPDLVLVRKEQERILTETRMIGAPDLLIEILSPSTRARDLGLKRERYRVNGVREYWIVDPEKRSITRWDFVNVPEEPVTFTEHSFESTAFPGVRLDVASTFAD
ncbi:MAG: Uma2 family endonuclease, partial [Planctomycetes bacterium]|nr:Uma2 family endonuclease [Planctomycetota bacterium]